MQQTSEGEMTKKGRKGDVILVGGTTIVKFKQIREIAPRQSGAGCYSKVISNRCRTGIRRTSKTMEGLPKPRRVLVAT